MATGKSKRNESAGRRRSGSPASVAAKRLGGRSRLWTGWGYYLTTQQKLWMTLAFFMLAGFVMVLLDTIVAPLAILLCTYFIWNRNESFTALEKKWFVTLVGLALYFSMAKLWGALVFFTGYLLLLAWVWKDELFGGGGIGTGLVEFAGGFRRGAKKGRSKLKRGRLARQMVALIVIVNLAPLASAEETAVTDGWASRIGFKSNVVQKCDWVTVGTGKGFLWLGTKTEKVCKFVVKETQDAVKADISSNDDYFQGLTTDYVKCDALNGKRTTEHECDRAHEEQKTKNKNRLIEEDLEGTPKVSLPDMLDRENAATKKVDPAVSTKKESDGSVTVTHDPNPVRAAAQIATQPATPVGTAERGAEVVATGARTTGALVKSAASSGPQVKSISFLYTPTNLDEAEARDLEVGIVRGSGIDIDETTWYVKRGDKVVHEWTPGTSYKMLSYQITESGTYRVGIKVKDEGQYGPVLWSHEFSVKGWKPLVSAVTVTGLENKVQVKATVSDAEGKLKEWAVTIDGQGAKVTHNFGSNNEASYWFDKKLGWLPAGDVTVRITVQDKEGLSDSVAQTVTVRATPPSSSSSGGTSDGGTTSGDSDGSTSEPLTLSMVAANVTPLVGTGGVTNFTFSAKAEHNDASATLGIKYVFEYGDGESYTVYGVSGETVYANRTYADVVNATGYQPKVTASYSDLSQGHLYDEVTVEPNPETDAGEGAGGDTGTDVMSAATSVWENKKITILVGIGVIVLLVVLYYLKQQNKLAQWGIFASQVSILEKMKSFGKNDAPQYRPPPPPPPSYGSYGDFGGFAPPPPPPAPPQRPYYANYQPKQKKGIFGRVKGFLKRDKKPEYQAPSSPIVNIHVSDDEERWGGARGRRRRKK